MQVEQQQAIKKIPVATKGSMETTICLGGREAPCFRLDTGERVLTQDGMARILGFDNGTAMARAISGSRMRGYVLRSLGAKGESGWQKSDKNSGLALGAKGESGWQNPLDPITFQMPQGGSLAKGYPSRFFGVVLRAYTQAHLDGALHHTQINQLMWMVQVSGELANQTIDALIDRAHGVSSEVILSGMEREIAEWFVEDPNSYAVEYDREFCELVARLYGRDPSRMTHKQVMGYSGTVGDRDVLCRLPGRLHRALIERNPKRPSGGRRRYTGSQLLKQHDDPEVEKGYNWFIRIRDRYKREMRASLDMRWSMEQHRARWDAVGEPFPPDSLWHDRHERKKIEAKQNLFQLVFPIMSEDLAA